MCDSKHDGTPGLNQQQPHHPQLQPPLARNPSSHKEYDSLLQIARTINLKVLDIGCGPGKDLLELLVMGARPSDLIGLDLEPQFSSSARTLATARGLPIPPFKFIQADLGRLVSNPTLSEKMFPPNTISGIICYRFFHLHPPDIQRALLRWLLSLLLTPSLSVDPSERPTPSILIGLQRSLPAGTPSGWTPISSCPSTTSSTDRDAHWVYSSSDWHDLVESSVIEYASQISHSGHKVFFGTEFFPGLHGDRRGAVEWWVKVEVG